MEKIDDDDGGDTDNVDEVAIIFPAFRGNTYDVAVIFPAFRDR